MQKIVPRFYQTEAVDAIFDYWANDGGNPLVEAATGVGKSLMVAMLSRKLVRDYKLRVLNLVHVKELVEQNANALLRAWPSAPLGINSAGVGRRDTRHEVLYCSIQSVWRKPELLGDRDCVIIDECHLLPKKNAGMYRSLLEALLDARPDMRVCGFTATPFRLDSGRLDKGDDALFDKIVYRYGVARGIQDGYLAPLISLRMDNTMSVKGLAKRGGDFTDEAVAKAADDDGKIRAAAAELVRHGENRRLWLSFCCGVRHAEKMADAVNALGVPSACITGTTPMGERTQIIKDYKAGKIRHLTNAMVLTTGFDSPKTDLVALFRPTLSTVLYVQSLGRGTRCDGNDIAESIANGKSNCLVLDFAGNVRRHGPIDDVVISGSPLSGGVDGIEDREPTVDPEARRTRLCPNDTCGCENSLTAQFCVNCGAEMVPAVAKHDSKPEVGLAILSQDKDPWTPIGQTHYFRHEKAGKPPSMRAEYSVEGRKTISHREWVCFEHTGFAAEKAAMWWKRQGGQTPVPDTVAEALNRVGELKAVTHIKIRITGDGYTEIIGRKLDTANYSKGPRDLFSTPPHGETSVLDARMPPGRHVWS